MSLKKGLIIGCGTVVLIAIIVIGLFVGWVMHVSQDIEGVSVSIDSPLDVKKGETFNMVVNVKNEREKKSLTISDIDISDEYLEGFVVISVNPAPKSSKHIPIDDSMSYTFNVSIPGGATNAFTFVIRAEKTGIFRGDVDVCEGQRFITVTAQTVVKE